MSFSRNNGHEARARGIRFNDEAISVDLLDGRTMTVPLAWYPRLRHGSQKERDNFEIIGNGTYIHWPDLDEDLTVAGLLAGKRSGESAASLRKWMASRKRSSQARPKKRVRTTQR